MATTDYEAQNQFINKCPHTANALTKLIMAMSDVYNNRGKKSFFGVDKGLKAYQQFEEKLRECLLCMVLDGMIKRNAEKHEYYDLLYSMICYAQEIWPNWHEAYAFADDFFVYNVDAAVDRIDQLIKMI